MTVAVILDLCYGDSGKGRVCHYLAKDFDIGCRFNGGANSGHTIVIGDNKYVTHLLPATVFYPGKVSILTPGVLVDPIVLKEDLKLVDTLKGGVAGRIIRVDSRCPVVSDKHVATDEKTGGKIGTTKRGIGPCMSDQVNRTGPRWGELYPATTFDAAEYLYNHIRRGRNVIFEGAQGHYLDLWHGTYPYVTSSTTTVGAVCTNAGIPPKMITDVYGILKPYTTRVGEGPFLTEEFGPVADFIREEGGEYGATTGRPRRIGWLNLPEVRRAIEMNGVNWVVITKSDVLDKLSSFPVCVDIGLKGEPIYREIQGWETPITEVTKSRDFPPKFKEFIAFLERSLHLPITLISVGPECDQMVKM